MSDDAVVQIISRLGVDFNQAIVGVEQLSASTTKLNAELKQLQVSAKEAAQQMGLAFTSTTGKMEATAAKTKAGAVMGEKIKQDFSRKLMETEVLLRRTLADAAKAGAYIPSGTNRSLGYVGALQQQVAAGKELTQQEIKAVESINKRARLRQLEIQSSAQALKLEQARAKTVGHVADQQGRVGLAQKQSTELAKMELLTLNQKMARMQATVQTKQLENSLTAIGSKTLGSELMLRQAELTNLIKQMEVNGKLNAQEMQRLNLLKGQVAALNNNVGAVSAIATADAKQAAAIARTEKANKKATEGANKHKKSVQDLNQEYNVLGSQFERRAGWFVAGTAFFGSLAALREIAVTIKDVEMGMTTIARITEDVNFNFEEMRDSLQGLGVEYGMGWENVSDIAIRWSQAGYNVADTLELTKSSLLALNTAELDAQYATQGLIAIMSQWNLTSEQLLPTIDKINKTADSYAVTSQDIVDGLNRVGAAAKNAGMTIEETIGAITVLREASGRTGKEVGTALNTIFSYMTRDKTINLMEALGIRVFEDEARTTFRSIIELMEELATRWQDTSVSSQLMTSVETELLESFNEEMATAVGLQEEWNDMQQRDISQAAAGVRRKNFFISLMSRFSKIQEVVNGQLDAEGYSMRENERTMATLEKQIQSLKAAAEQFAVSIGDAGLLDQMKGLVKGTTDTIQWFNGLDDTLKTLIITFAEVTLAAKVATAMVNMMGLTGARAAGGIMRGWVVPIFATTASMRVLTGTVTGLATVLKNVGAGLLGFFGGPVGLAITAVAVAAGALYNHVKKTREELAALPTTVQNMQAQFEITQKLEEEYSSLTNSVIKTAEEKQKLADVTAELGRLFPEAISNIDAEGNATELNNDILRESIKLRKEDIALKQEQLADQFADFEKSETGKDFKKNLDKIEELEEKVKSSTSVLERYKELFGEDGVITKGEQREINLVRKSWQDAKEELNALNQEQLKNIQTFDRQAVAALNQNEAFRQLSDTVKNKLVVSIREFNNNDLSKASAEILKLVQGDLPSRMDEMGAAFKRFGQSAKDASALNELNADFIKFRDAVVTVGQDLNWTGDQSVQLAYVLMECINPIETAEFKMWKLEEVIHQVGDSSMTTANAAAIASNILATKVSDATMKTIAAHWDDIKAVKDRAKAYEILAQAIFLDVTKGGLAVGMAGTSDTIRQQTREMQGYLNAVAELEALTRGGGSSGGGGGGPSPGPGAAAKGAGKEIDYLAEAIQRLTDAAKQYELVNMDLESVLDAVNRRLGVSNAEYDYLNGKVEAGTATAQDYARMQELLARKIALLKNEQVQLANANQEYQRQIESLTPVLAKATAEYDRFKAVGDEEHTKDAASAVSALKSEIDSLSGAIASNTQKMWENKDTLANLTDSAEKSNRAIRDANIKSLKDEIDYLTRDGASQQELSRAYGRQADYIRLLNEQRDDLNKRIGESQRIISELTHAQSQLNTSTEEGKLSYDQYGQAIANATSKLADLKSQQIQVNGAINEGKDAIVKRNLAELDRLHKAHLMTLEQYIQALDDLERQYGSVMSVSQQWTIDLAQSNSLLQKWTDDINSALEKARKSFEVEMKRIDEVISQTQKGLSDFKDAITRIFDGIDKSTSRNFSKDILDSIPGLLPRTFVGNQSYLDYVSSILTGSSGPGKLRSSLSDVGMTVSEIFAGKYMPVGNETDTTTTTPIYSDTAYINRDHDDLWKRTMESVHLNREHYNAAIATWLESNPVFLKWLADNNASNSQANRRAFIGTNEGNKELSDNFSYVGPARDNPNIMVHIKGGAYVGLDIPWSMTGEAAPTAQTTFDLSKEDFLAALKTNVEGLSQASTQIDDALANVDAWRESEVNRIDGLIEAKQLKLQQDIELLDGLFDQLDKSAQKFERTQTKERFQRSLNAAIGIESPIGVVPTAGDLQSLFNNLPTINLDNLMTFDPTNFKNAVTQGLTTLEDARQTATGYIQSLADSTKAQIAVINAELKALDEESQKDTRGDAEEAHNKRLEELAEKRRYHEVRTGLEHVEAIADIDKQIAEENESWAKKQRDWGKEDKKAELQDKKASLQETQALLAQALQDLIGYINSEIQARKEATQEYKSNLQDQVQGEVKALNDEKVIAVKRAELLTRMLTGLKAHVTDAIAEWKRLADERVDITDKETKDIIKLYEGQKETLKGIWEGNESGIRSMMQSGTLAQLAMMAALGKADGSAVQDLVNAITDKGIRENLQPIISRITGIAAPAPTPITPTPTPNPQPDDGKTPANPQPDDGKTPANPWKHIANVNSSNPYLKNSNGYWYASKEIWQAPSMGYSVGWDAASKRMIIDGKAVSTIIDNNDKGYAQIREYFEGIGRTVKWNESRKRIDIYHEGGTITPFGRKPLLSDEVPIIARHNEMIFPDVPKYRVGIDFKRMQDTLEQVSKPNRSGALVNAAVIDKAADRIIKAIKEKAGVTVGKLVNVEHYEPQDSTDVEIFSREVMRRVAQL